jgi:hypothetical protein
MDTRQLAIKAVLSEEIDNYLDRELGGGNLHIVLEDFNFEVENIKFCYQACLDNDDVQGAIICEFLLKLDDPEQFLRNKFSVR